MEQGAYRNRNSQDLRKKIVDQIRRRGPHTRATLTAGTGISITNASGTATNSAGTGPVSVASNSVTIANQYSPNSVFCDNGPKEIVDLVNPVTGKTWMDRNLGAERAATLSYTNQVQFLIGGAGDGPSPGGIYGGFNGKLDDIGFWSRALTQDEILKIYQGKRF